MNFKFKNLFFTSIFYVGSLLSNNQPTGIGNVGNVCFMNAVLQCLYHSSDITTFLLQNEAYFKPDSVAAEYIKFLKNYKNALNETTEINPIDWCQKIWTLEEAGNIRFTKEQAADANEFLAITLGHLGLDSTISDVEPDKITARLPYPLQKLANDPIVNAVGSTLKKYSYGSLSSVKNEPIISVDIVNQIEIDNEFVEIPNDNLESCLDDYFDTQDLRIFDLPKYLIINLKRFKGTIDETKKIENAVPFPMWLDIKKYLDKNSPDGLSPLYELYGLVLHGGYHYTSYVKIEDQWWECNDSIVSKIATEDVEALANQSEELQEKTPYILFYRQISSGEPWVYKKFGINMKTVFNNVIERLPNILDGLIEQLNEAMLTSSPGNVSKYEKAIEIMTIVKNDKSVLLDSFFEYIDLKKIDLTSIMRSLEIGLIDEEFLASQIAVYIQDTSKQNLYPGQEYQARLYQLNEM